MKNHKTSFIEQIQSELLRVDPAISYQQSLDMAKNILHMFLSDEKIDFGAEGFSWDEESAIELAHAYEIDYWDK